MSVIRKFDCTGTDRSSHLQTDLQALHNGLTVQVKNLKTQHEELQAAYNRLDANYKHDREENKAREQRDAQEFMAYKQKTDLELESQRGRLGVEYSRFDVPDNLDEKLRDEKSQTYLSRNETDFRRSARETNLIHDDVRLVLDILCANPVPDNSGAKMVLDNL